MSVEDSGVAMAEVARAMVLELVDRPQDVSVVLGKGDGFVLLTVSVSPWDVGRVIGGKGQTARALRAILGAIARRRGVRWELVILQDAGRKVVS